MDLVREMILKSLYKIDVEKAYSNLVIDELLKQKKDKITKKDINFIVEIIYGTTSWRLTIDTIIEKYSNIKLKKISPWILNCLRMGIYQIIWLDKVPKSAAVNESVKLAKRYGHKSSSNFVNAILRKIEKKDYDELFQIENKKERIVKTTSTPLWLVEKLFENYSFEEIQSICMQWNQRPWTSIRPNLLKTTKKEIEEYFSKWEFKPSEIEPFLCFENLPDVEKNTLFQEGYFTIQDVSAGLAAKILNPQPGDMVLDACSAPGGKTTHMAELMKNQGKILAFDIYDHRIKKVLDVANRLGISIIETKLQDAQKKEETYIEKFDKILLDVPCMGIGVIKRKPDIKWHRTKEDLEEITKIQLEILEVNSQYLKKGGELVYSTCSILKEENEEILEKFLKNHTEYEIFYEETTKSDKTLQSYYKNNKYFLILPENRKDGFFISKIRRKI